MRQLVKSFLGRTVPLDCYMAVNAYVAARDIRSGRRWESELDLLPRFVHSGDTVVDIGGNHGLYSFHLSRLVGPQGSVHVFEPIPANLVVLRRTVAPLSNVHVHTEGLGETNTTAEFVMPIENHVPMTGWSHRATAGDTGIMYRCAIRKLDDVLPSDNVSFIKCDIEGGELLAFRGAQKLIDRCRPTVFCELVPDFLARFGCTIQEAIGFFAARSYVAYRCEQSSLIPADCSAKFGNYLFTASSGQNRSFAKSGPPAQMSSGC